MIYAAVLVFSTQAGDFEKRLEQAIDRFQGDQLEVEVQFGGQAGRGNNYSALVIGRST